MDDVAPMVQLPHERTPAVSKLTKECTKVNAIKTQKVTKSATLSEKNKQISKSTHTMRPGNYYYGDSLLRKHVLIIPEQACLTKVKLKRDSDSKVSHPQVSIDTRPIQQNNYHVEEPTGSKLTHQDIHSTYNDSDHSSERTLTDIEMCSETHSENELLDDSDQPFLVEIEDSSMVA